MPAKTSPAAQPAGDSPAAAPRVTWRLSALMALQWGTIGAWVTTLSTYLDANTGDRGAAAFGPSFIGDIAAASACGALFSPVICGLLVDRWFNTEWVISALHAASAALLLALSFTHEQSTFFVLAVAYHLCYAPTNALSSSVALRLLPDPPRQFPRVRAMGTIGYIVTATLVGLWPLVGGHSIERTVIPMWISAGVHVVAALYALTLPSTPPEAASGGRFAGIGRLWTDRSVMMFLGFALLVAIPFRGYEAFINLFLNQNNYAYPAWLQTFAQYSEVVVMLSIPLLTARVRLKWLVLLGALAWALRFALLAFSGGHEHPWMAYGGIVLHGFSFVLVFILGQLYIDRLAPPDARGTAQGMFVLAVFGLGSLVSARVAGWAQSVWLTPEGVDPPPYLWANYWLLQCGLSLVAAAVFAVFFIESPGRPPAPPAPDELSAAEAQNPVP